MPSCQSVFQSQVARNSNQRRLVQAQNEPGPSSYTLPQHFDMAIREKDVGSRPFRQAVPRKIVPVNLYDPHAAVDSDLVTGLGPGKYDIPDGFRGVPVSDDNDEQSNTQKLNHVLGGKLYIENNLDRFG